MKYLDKKILLFFPNETNLHPSFTIAFPSE